MPVRSGYTYAMSDTDEVSVKQAAAILDVSPNQVLWYRKRGYLTGREPLGEGNGYVFKRADVEWLKANKPKRTGRPKSKRNEDPPCDPPP